MNYDAVIVASGKGERANLGYNKVFFKLKDGKTVLEHALSLFISDKDCLKIVVVTNEEYFAFVPEDKKIIKVVGGNYRKDSVYNGLKKCQSEYVLIHDAARPFLSSDALNDIKEELKHSDACILAKEVIDTVKYVEDDYIKKTIDRSKVFLAETPQAFKLELILNAYKKAEDIPFTDEASLLETLNEPIKIVIDRHDNHKLTREEDFLNI